MSNEYKIEIVVSKELLLHTPIDQLHKEVSKLAWDAILKTAEKVKQHEATQN